MSDRASLSSVKALFGFGNALVACEQKLAQGFEHIQQVIDREYGAGMGDRVSRDIGRTQTRDLSGGIKRSDLGLIGRTADRLTQNMLNAALTDRNIGGLQGHRPDYDKMQAFFDAHFAVATNPKFWWTHAAELNVEVYGSALARNVLNRVGQNGTISQSDFDDLSKAFGPYDKSFNPTMPDCPAPSPLGGHLVGPANEARLNELTQAVCERFCKLTPALAVNLRSQQFSKIQTTFAQANTSANRITATTGPSRVSTHRTRGSGRSETRVRTRRRSGPVGCDGRTG